MQENQTKLSVGHGGAALKHVTFEAGAKKMSEKLKNGTAVLRYSDIAAKTAKPCVVPTQRRIRPEEVRHLAAAGCKAIMIGAVVMGGARPEDVKRATAAFRAAADAV